MIIKGQDFIFTGLQHWDLSIGSNARDIALEVSKHNRVLYVNPPLDKKTYHGKKNTPEIIQGKHVIDKITPPIRQINPNLWIVDYPFTVWPINFLPGKYLFNAVNRMNQKKMYAFIRTVLKQLLFKKYILFIDNDIYRSFYAKEFLKPTGSIYYRRDYLLGVNYWKKHGEQLEPLLAAKSNLVAANSQYLANGMKPYNIHCHDIGQGIDLSSFQPDNQPVPTDILDIPHPIIGYVGTLTSLRLDIHLLDHLAQACPAYSFVFVGGEDVNFQQSALHQRENVYFTGQRPTSAMPNYISAFDICINPQLVNPITIGNYPRKIDEYLALGKPVIAVRTPMMQFFENLVYLSNSARDFQFTIENIIAHPDLQTKELQQQRVAFAQNHTWENSVAKLYTLVKTIQTDVNHTN